MKYSSLYEALDLHPAADAAAIQQAFDQLSTQYDPARFRSAAPDLRALAAERYAEINRAFATLNDPLARAAYDQSIRDVSVDEVDYHPLSAAPMPSNRFAWLSAPIMLLVALVLVGAGTSFLVWSGLQPPEPEAKPEIMPLFAQMIAAEIPDPQVRDQLLTLDSMAAQAESLVQQDPRNHVPWVMLGNAHFDFIQTIYEAAPDGQAYALNLDRWLKASEAYTKALEYEPFQPIVRSDLALTYVRYGVGIQNGAYVDQAIEQADLALQQDDQTPLVLMNVGRVFALADQSRQADANRLWQQVIALAPDTLLAQQAQSLLEGSRP